MPMNLLWIPWASSTCVCISRLLLMRTTDFHLARFQCFAWPFFSANSSSRFIFTVQCFWHTPCKLLTCSWHAPEIIFQPESNLWPKQRSNFYPSHIYWQNFLCFCLFFAFSFIATWHNALINDSTRHFSRKLNYSMHHLERTTRISPSFGCDGNWHQCRSCCKRKREQSPVDSISPAHGILIESNSLALESQDTHR